MSDSAIDTARTDEFRWNLLQVRAAEKRAVRAFDLFRNEGIEPVLIKGIAAGRYYPEAKPRVAIDTDLAVGTDHFDRAYALVVKHAPEGLAIDLHRELRHLDTVAWDDLFANSVEWQLDGGTIRILRPEDHLRVLCVHWLTDGASQKERLWDIYYAIANRPPDFDWSRVFDIVAPNRRRWIVCAIGLAHKYLGLDLSDTPIAREAADLPAWLVKTVEREWANPTKFVPLEEAFHKGGLLRQIPRRLRPDPIWATIQMNGSFDARTRFFYQFASFFARIPASYRRMFGKPSL